MTYSDNLQELERNFLLSLRISQSRPTRDGPIQAVANSSKEATLRDRVRGRRSDRLVNTAEAGTETPQPSPA